MKNWANQDNGFLVEVVSQFISSEVSKYHFNGAVIALSGGLDSALVSILSHKALHGSIKLVYMPFENPKESYEDALSVANLLAVSLEVVDLTNTAETIIKACSPDTPLRIGNILARLRMTVLFDISSREKALVIGTSNKTEILVGYSTWYGDSAAGIMPIGDLYKTQVRNIAKLISVPEKIIQKPPSAELWIDQTDETELGIPYDRLDQILYHLVDQRLLVEEIIAMGFSQDEVDKVVKLTRRAYYKQKTPIICKVSDRTVGIDYRFIKEASLVD